MTDNEGWTHIKPKSRRPKRHNNINNIAQHQHEPPKQPSEITLRSVSDITSEHRALRSEWEQSPCCAALRSLVTASSKALPPISRAICLGIGSFDPPDGGWEAKRRAHVQLIAFLIMVEELEKSQEKIPCIFQEPVFTQSDKAFLASLGHRVVDSPEACELVDQHSFLFGVHLYRPIYAMALRSSSPAVFVGTGWDVWDQVSLSSEPSDDLVNLQEMERSYKRFSFPRDPTLTTAFSSTSIYFRPQASSSFASVDEGAPQEVEQKEEEQKEEEQKEEEQKEEEQKEEEQKEEAEHEDKPAVTGSEEQDLVDELKSTSIS